MGREKLTVPSAARQLPLTLLHSLCWVQKVAPELHPGGDPSDEASLLSTPRAPSPAAPGAQSLQLALELGIELSVAYETFA